MSLRGAAFVLTVSCLPLLGCASSDPAKEGSAGGDCKAIDYAAYEKGDHFSLETDLIPIFGLHCSAGACHSATGKKAGLILGQKGNFDATAKWKYSFPSETDPDPDKPQPLTRSTIDAVHASLTAAATTVNGGAVKRVVPLHPEDSFLLQKLTDVQNARGYACTNQDTSRSDLPCGASMPLDAPPWCSGEDRRAFDAIARWVAEGALND
jgi:hypothetical protein